MKNRGQTITRVLPVVIALLLALLLGGASSTFGQNRIPNGMKVKKFKGIVGKREPDWFTMHPTTGGAETTVILTADTEVKGHKRGVFRGSKDYGETFLLRGLRLEVDGVGNADGALVAEKIRFDEQDLRTAQALRTTVDPMEAELREQLKRQQEEQERLAGQLAETTAIANQARTEAGAANEAAKKAQDTANYANARINGLDDFDLIKTITVNFKLNSSILGPEARATIDEAAEWVKTQNTKGWVIAVVGFADSTGNSAHNRTLSERRADSVIYYLVTKHKLPQQRLVQPFGYGHLEPVADNKSAEGRAQNRRVEIRLMANKGITGNVGSPPGR
jgi:outer membrane protein OmpA-like peptidoglycan-associated protein